VSLQADAEGLGLHAEAVEGGWGERNSDVEGLGHAAFIACSLHRRQRIYFVNDSCAVR